MSSYVESVRYPRSQGSSGHKAGATVEEGENFELKMKIFYLEEKLAKLEDAGGKSSLHHCHQTKIRCVSLPLLSHPVCLVLACSFAFRSSLSESRCETDASPLRGFEQESKDTAN